MKDVGHGDVLPNNLLVKEEIMASIIQMKADKVNRKLKKFPVTIRLRKFVTAPFYDSLFTIV